MKSLLETLPFLTQLPNTARRRLESELCTVISAAYPCTLESLDWQDLRDFEEKICARLISSAALRDVPASVVLRHPLQDLVIPLQSPRILCQPVAFSPAKLASEISESTSGEWHELRSWCLGDVLDLDGFTYGELVEFFAGVIYVGMSLEMSSGSGEEQPLNTRLKSLPTTLHRIPPLTLNDHLRQITGWAAGEYGAENLFQAMQLAESDEDLSHEAALARSALQRIDIRAFAGEVYDNYDLKLAIERAISLLAGTDSPHTGPNGSPASRDFVILTRRILPIHNKATLQELAQCFGEITKARVHQLERLILNQLRQLRDNPDQSSLNRAAKRLSRSLGVAFPRDDLLERVHSATGLSLYSGSHQIPIEALLLLWLAGPYRQIDGWVVSESNRQVPAEVRSIIDQQISESSDRHASIHAVTNRVEALGVRPEYSRPLIEGQQGFRIIDEFLYRWNSIPEKTHTVLSVHEQPMTIDDIHYAIGESYSRSSVSNAIAKDERFVRSDVSSFGLQEWGLEEYSTIEQEIVEELEAMGGEASLQHIIETLTSKFDVAEGSVRAYLSGPRFVRTPAGDIRVATDSDHYASLTKKIEEIRNCFHTGGSWSYRTQVNSDLLRGSGSRVPGGFLLEVGIGPNESKVMTTPYGEVRLGWPSINTYIGSVRQVIEDLGGEDGDYLFVRIVDDQSLDFFLVRKSDLECVSVPERLMLQTGQQLGSMNDDPYSMMASALKIERWTDDEERRLLVRQRLTTRGEDDLLGLLDELEQADESSDIDELLDLFTG